MKIWIKLVIGSALGIFLGVVAPQTPGFTAALAWLEQLVLRLGRYTLVPVLFFSLAIGFYQLRKDGKLLATLVKSVLLLAGVCVFVIFAGIAAALVFSPEKIDIIDEVQPEQISINVAASVLELFPGNMFSALFGDGVYLLPLYVFAIFLGMGLSYDKTYSKPVIALIDSLSRIFFHIASFFIEILGFLMIALCAYWSVRFRDALRMDVFGGLIALLSVIAAVLAFVVFPLLLYLLKPRSNPWAVLYGSAAPAIAGFFSGDLNFSLPVLLRHGKENFGINRRSAAFTVAMFSTFCRAGSAMVAAVAFIAIFNSYSRIEISPAEVVSVALNALAVSFLLSRHPGNAAYAALVVLCHGFARDFEEGYLILRPIAFYLVAVGTLIDIMIVSFANYAVARMNGYTEEKTPGRFI
jgi:Na+/H+-dicarboxylate symporter